MLTEMKKRLLDRKILIICTMIYRLSLDVAYLWVLSPRFSYSLLTTDVNLFKCILSIIFTLVTMIWYPVNVRKPSTYLFGIMHAIIFMPTVSYYWLNDQATLFILVETLCFVLIGYCLQFSRMPMPHKMRLDIKMPARFGRMILLSLFCFYVLGALAVIIMNGGIDLRVLSWSEVYEVRAENSVSGIWGYVLNWCAKSFMPFFFAYFLIKKDYVGMGLTCLLQCLLFLSFGFKAFAMAIVMIFGVSILVLWDRKKFNWHLQIMLGIFNMIACVFADLQITQILMQLVPYRTLFLPSQGQFEYYTFFTNHDHLFFSEGMVGRLLGIEYPYDDQIGRIVNQYIYGPEKNSNGNTGVFSYGFADCGFLGMVLSALIIIAVLYLVDRYTQRLPAILPVSAMAYQMFVLNDNSIFISLNTGGIIWTVGLLLVLNWIYPGIRADKRHPVNERLIAEFDDWYEKRVQRKKRKKRK